MKFNLATAEDLYYISHFKPTFILFAAPVDLPVAIPIWDSRSFRFSNQFTVAVICAASLTISIKTIAYTNGNFLNHEALPVIILMFRIFYQRLYPLLSVFYGSMQTFHIVEYIERRVCRIVS